MFAAGTKTNDAATIIKIADLMVILIETYRQAVKRAVSARVLPFEGTHIKQKLVTAAAIAQLVCPERRTSATCQRADSSTLLTTDQTTDCRT